MLLNQKKLCVHNMLKYKQFNSLTMKTYFCYKYKTNLFYNKIHIIQVHIYSHTKFSRAVRNVVVFCCRNIRASLSELNQYLIHNVKKTGRIKYRVIIYLFLYTIVYNDITENEKYNLQ